MEYFNIFAKEIKGGVYRRYLAVFIWNFPRISVINYITIQDDNHCLIYSDYFVEWQKQYFFSTTTKKNLLPKVFRIFTITK